MLMFPMNSVECKTCLKCFGSTPMQPPLLQLKRTSSFKWIVENLIRCELALHFGSAGWNELAYSETFSSSLIWEVGWNTELLLWLPEVHIELRHGGERDCWLYPPWLQQAAGLRWEILPGNNCGQQSLSPPCRGSIWTSGSQSETFPQFLLNHGLDQWFPTFFLQGPPNSFLMEFEPPQGKYISIFCAFI